MIRPVSSRTRINPSLKAIFCRVCCGLHPLHEGKHRVPVAASAAATMATKRCPRSRELQQHDSSGRDSTTRNICESAFAVTHGFALCPPVLADWTRLGLTKEIIFPFWSNFIKVIALAMHMVQPADSLLLRRDGVVVWRLALEALQGWKHLNSWSRSLWWRRPRWRRREDLSRSWRLLTSGCAVLPGHARQRVVQAPQW